MALYEVHLTVYAKNLTIAADVEASMIMELNARENEIRGYTIRKVKTKGPATSRNFRKEQKEREDSNLVQLSNVGMR